MNRKEDAVHWPIRRSVEKSFVNVWPTSMQSCAGKETFKEIFRREGEAGVCFKTVCKGRKEKKLKKELA